MFLYDEHVVTVGAQLRDQAINLAGGQSTGKSTFVSNLARLFEQQGNPPVIVKGAERESGIRELASLADRRPPVNCVLIDDLDHLLLPDETQGVESIRELISILFDLVAERTNSGQRKTHLLVTTTGRFFDFLNPRLSYQKVLLSLPKDVVVSYSRLDQMLNMIHLDPWESDWRSSWKRKFCAEFQDDLQDAEIITTWADALAEQAGGHPGLFGPLLNKLRAAAQEYRKDGGAPTAYGRLFVRQPDHGDRLGNEARRARLILRKIDEWLDDDEFRPIRSTLRRLRDSSDALEQNAFIELVRMSGGESAEPPEDKYVRDLLQFEYALIGEDSRIGDYFVPGRYLRSVIRRAAHGLQLVTVEPDGSSPHRGMIRVQTAAGEKTIRLAHGKWELFRLLYEKRNELVTINEIMDRTSMGKRAVQNIVTRLRQSELREANVEINNERDRGYRLVVQSPGHTLT